MTKIRTVAPTELAVDLAAARANMRIDGDHMDGLLTIWIKGVIGALEHLTGQCLMEQTWQVRLAEFPAIPRWRVGDACAGAMPVAVALPHPVMSITSVKYLDQDGAEHTMAPADYKLTVERYQSYLTPARGTSWPTAADEPGAVTIVAQCGYGSTPDKTPDEVQLYILAKLVEQFDPITRMERDTVQSTFVDGLLDACKCYA